MRRGQQSTYLSLFDTSTTIDELQAPIERKGRSEMLHSKRNELLIHRHYYYVKIVGHQYSKILSTLEMELFITQRTIVDTIQKNSDILKSLSAENPGVSYFKKKSPFMNW